MKTNVTARYLCAKLGGRRSVHVALFDNTHGGKLMFTAPIEKSDFRDGRPQPRASGKRHKGQIVTEISLSNKALIGLRKILNIMPL
jgi:hypothetical protein